MRLNVALGICALVVIVIAETKGSSDLSGILAQPKDTDVNILEALLGGLGETSQSGKSEPVPPFVSHKVSIAPSLEPKAEAESIPTEKMVKSYESNDKKNKRYLIRGILKRLLSLKIRKQKKQGHSGREVQQQGQFFGSSSTPVEFPEISGIFSLPSEQVDENDDKTSSENAAIQSILESNLSRQPSEVDESSGKSAGLPQMSMSLRQSSGLFSGPSAEDVNESPKPEDDATGNTPPKPSGQSLEEPVSSSNLPQEPIKFGLSNSESDTGITNFPTLIGGVPTASELLPFSPKPVDGDNDKGSYTEQDEEDDRTGPLQPTKQQKLEPRTTGQPLDETESPGFFSDWKNQAGPSKSPKQENEYNDEKIRALIGHVLKELKSLKNYKL